MRRASESLCLLAITGVLLLIGENYSMAKDSETIGVASMTADKTIILVAALIDKAIVSLKSVQGRGTN